MDREYKKIKEWYDNNADIYAKKSAVLLRSQLTYFISLLPKNGKILDIGSGPGHDTEYFAKKGFEAIGIDFSTGMIEFAEKNCLHGNFKRMDMLEIAKFFPKNYFNGIWASSSITHLKKPDILLVLRQIKNVVALGAPIIVILKRRRSRKIRKNKIIFNEFYKKDIEEYSRKSRLKIVKIVDFSVLGTEWWFIHLLK